jgi:hypothetical protein
MSLTFRQPRPRSLACLGLVVADLTVFTQTNATRVASFTLIIGFLALAATVYYAAYGLLAFARLYGLPVRRKRRLAASLTGLAGCLVALQSVGELNVRDVLLLLPLVTIGYLYSFYGAGASSPDAPMKG